jgi:asparagine synthase (glutamine-hydrolysing)
MEMRVHDMAATLVHRGPDDDGTWIDPDTGIAIGFRRLAIQDLSPAGHQPMESADRRLVLAFNGEVYNFIALRRELEDQGHKFRGHSDSEVVVEACAAWGVENAVRRFAGMFAFAIWDRQERALYLARDRLGVKPLYWANFGNLFLFGSELKALRVHPGWTPRIDRGALAAYLRHTYFPAPYTVYEGVRKLLPAHVLRFDPTVGSLSTDAYWHLEKVAADGLAAPLDLTDTEAEAELGRLLGDAVTGRMVADVPVGAFLSGGIDSSAVVAAMQDCAHGTVRTFTIGFTEGDYDEAVYAKKVAHHLGTDHSEFYLEPATARNLIPELATWYDEPFADSSQIPMALVSKLACEKVTVVLTGDGGDELFCGYGRYFAGTELLDRIRRVPSSLHDVAARTVKTLPPKVWDRILGLVPGRFRPGAGGDALHWYANLLQASGREQTYRQMVSFWTEPEKVVPGAVEKINPMWGNTPRIVERNFQDHMQYLDTGTYLPDDILTKVDRATMAFSLEARSPFLDHRLVEFAWRLPRRLLTRDGSGKWLLKKFLGRYLARELFERPKQGFGVPVGSWLRGPLRDWAEDLLDENRLKTEGLFDPNQVRRCWREHLAGKEAREAQIWAVLMFQSWKGRWGL